MLNAVTSIRCWRFSSLLKLSAVNGAHMPFPPKVFPMCLGVGPFSVDLRRCHSQEYDHSYSNGLQHSVRISNRPSDVSCSDIFLPNHCLIPKIKEFHCPLWKQLTCLSVNDLKLPEDSQKRAHSPRGGHPRVPVVLLNQE